MDMPLQPYIFHIPAFLKSHKSKRPLATHVGFFVMYSQEKHSKETNEGEGNKQAQPSGVN